MENYLKWIEEIWKLFVGNGRVVVTALIVMLLFLLWPGNKRLKQFLLYPSLIILIFINNPLSIYYIVDKELMAYSRYVRLYWLLPISFVLAFLCVKVVKKARKWMQAMWRRQWRSSCWCRHATAGRLFSVRSGSTDGS